MRTQALEYDGEIIDITAEDKAKIEKDNSQAEDDILQEFNADPDGVNFKIKISKVDPTSKNWADCFFCSPEDFPIVERLRTEYGAGTFKALVYKNGKLHRNLTYHVAPKIGVPEPSAVEPTGPIAEVAQLLKTQNEQMAAFMQGQSPSAPPANPMEMFTSMMAAMASAKEIFGPAQTKPANPLENMEILIKMMELTRDMNGGGGDTGVYDVLKELVKGPLGEQMGQQLKHTPALQGPQNPQLPQNHQPLKVSEPTVTDAPTDGAAPPAYQNAPTSSDIVPKIPEGLLGLPDHLLAQIQQQILFWADRAKAGSDPALYADLAVDTYEPLMLTALVNREDLKEIAIYFDAEIEKHWPWFESLKREIEAALTTHENISNVDPVNHGQMNAHFEISPGDGAAAANPDGIAGRPGSHPRDAENHEIAGTQRNGEEKPADPAKGQGSHAKSTTTGQTGGDKSAS